MAIQTMLILNKLGATVANLDYVHAMTDVTGFGLLGHLTEVCEGSGLSAEIAFEKIPRFDFLDEYLNQNCVPGGAIRNWDSYGHKISAITDMQRSILADPQTSGGLLIGVDPHYRDEFERTIATQQFALVPFGRMVSTRDKTIEVLKVSV